MTQPSDPFPAFPLEPAPFAVESRTVPMTRAIEWLREGWELFLREPRVWCLMGLVFLLIMVALVLVPLLGELAAHILLPILAAGLMFSSRKVARRAQRELLAEGAAVDWPEDVALADQTGSFTKALDDKLVVADMFEGFRHNTGPVVMVGVYFMCGWVLILALGAVISFGAALSAVLVGGGSVEPKAMAVAFSGVVLAVLVGGLLSVPLILAVWFAPALAIFHGVPAMKAMEKSFMACVRNLPAFFIYGLLGLVILFLAMMSFALGLVVAVPVLSAASYAAYRDIFPGA